MSVFWFVLFSINSLGSCIIAASAGSVWANLGTQEKFTVIVAVITNWTGVIMAYIKQAAKKIESGEIPIGDDTRTWQRTDTNVQTIATKQTPPASLPAQQLNP